MPRKIVAAPTLRRGRASVSATSKKFTKDEAVSQVPSAVEKKIKAQESKIKRLEKQLDQAAESNNNLKGYLAEERARHDASYERISEHTRKITQLNHRILFLETKRTELNAIVKTMTETKVQKRPREPTDSDSVGEPSSKRATSSSTALRPTKSLHVDFTRTMCPREFRETKPEACYDSNCIKLHRNDVVLRLNTPLVPTE